MNTRRNLAFGGVFAAALLLAEAQMAPYGVAPPGNNTPVQEPPPAQPAPVQGGGFTQAGVPDGGAGIAQGGVTADGGSAELQTLRSQLAAQEDQVRLLQQQVASQQASQETLARTQVELQGLRQQVADGQARAEQERAAEVSRVNGISAAIGQLQDVDQQIIDGRSTIDFGTISGTLPPDAAYYVQAGEEALARGDYLYARYYVELAVSSARTSLVGNGATAVPH